MSLLEAVTEARELRQTAEREFRRALVRAHDGGHSYRTIAPAAELSFNGVAWLIRRERGLIDGSGRERSHIAYVQEDGTPVYTFEKEGDTTQ